MARPTAFKEEYHELAYNYSLLGATDKEIAGFFGVAVSTLNKWKKDVSGFSESLKRGKDQADGQVAAKLFIRAIGYEYKETKTEGGRDPDNAQKIIGNKVTQTTKHVPPDVTAQIFWLKNRQKKNWRDKWDIDLTNKTPPPSKIDESMSIEDMAQAYADKIKASDDD